MSEESARDVAGSASRTAPARRMTTYHGEPVRRGAPVQFTFDGEPVDAFAGETVATALLAAGIHQFCTMPDGSARQPLCNMGTCFDCSVTIGSRHYVRACLTPVADGLAVESEDRR